MNVEDIKKLREETGAGVMDVKKALEESSGDMAKAKKILQSKGIKIAKKKAEREIKAGRVFSYVHGDGRVGALVKLGCETDFVAKNDAFNELGKEIAMQVAAMNPKDVDELLKQVYIRDSSKKISDLVIETTAKTGENIALLEIVRLSLAG